VLIWVAGRAMRVRELAGALVALGGIVVLYARDLHLGSASGQGGLELLAAAACYAAGTVYIQRVIPEVPPLATAAAATTVSAVAMPRSPLWPASLSPARSLPSGSWSSPLRQPGCPGLVLRADPEGGGDPANLAGYLAPAFAVAYGRAFLSEPIHAQAIAGLALILIGSCIAAT